MKTLAALFLLCGVTVLTAKAEIVTGRVIAVADGDTLTVLDSVHQRHRIRLSGIDAPEKAQDFGQKAKAHLSALAFGQHVTADCTKRDRYQREVCVVTANGKDVGLEQIHAGMAWWYRQYAQEQSPQKRGDYEQAEIAARSERHGLWRIENPIPPWEWRHQRHEN